MVDRLSKYAHFIALKHPFKAASVAEMFLREIIKLHGFPTTIVSDRDKVFLINFWTELFRLQGTELKRSTAYHPQMDGQTEIVNKVVESYLRCFVGDKRNSWVQWLPWAEYSYNTSFYLAFKFTPFQVVYGREPPKLIRIRQGQTMVEDIDAMLKVRDSILDELRINLLRSQNVMETIADKKRRDVEFQIGEWSFYVYSPIGSNRWQGNLLRSWLLGSMGHLRYCSALEKLLTSWSYQIPVRSIPSSMCHNLNVALAISRPLLLFQYS